MPYIEESEELSLPLVVEEKTDNENNELNTSNASITPNTSNEITDPNGSLEPIPRLLATKYLSDSEINFISLYTDQYHNINFKFKLPAFSNSLLEFELCFGYSISLYTDLSLSDSNENLEDLNACSAYDLVVESASDNKRNQIQLSDGTVNINSDFSRIFFEFSEEELIEISAKMKELIAENLYLLNSYPVVEYKFETTWPLYDCNVSRYIYQRNGV
jgi:hypothetical protein